MDGFFNEQKVMTVKAHLKTQALVEGEVPFPEDETLRKMLDFAARVELSGVNVLDGCIKTEGKIRIDALAENSSGTVISFSSWAMLEHEVPCAGACSEHAASVKCTVQSLDMHIRDGALKLVCVVDMDILVTQCEEAYFDRKLENIDDAEVKSEFFTCFDTFKIGGGEFRLRDEVKINDIVDIASVDGYAVADRVSVNSTQACIEGRIIMRMLYLDKYGVYSLRSEEIHFEESVEITGGYEGAFARLKLEKLSARVIGEEFELAAAEACVKAEIFASAEKKLTLPVDAYSPTKPFECVVESKDILLPQKSVNIPHRFRESFSLPDGSEKIQRVLFCTAAVNSLDMNIEDGRINPCGVIGVNCVYVSESGSVETFRSDAVFRFESGAEAGVGSCIIADTLYADACAEASGTQVDVSFDAVFCAEIFDIAHVGVISGVEECEMPKIPHGIVIYSPGRDETLFDIGKRFMLSCNSLLEADGEITDKIRNGKKIVLTV